MDASALRWTLAIIGIVLLVGIYLYGLQQNKMRKRTARETFTREEIDSAFIEDEKLREELDSLSHIISDDASSNAVESININPALEAGLKPVEIPEPELFIADAVASIEADKLVCHYLKHSDHRLITGEELASTLVHTDIEMNPEGLLEYQQDGELCFTIASLSPPGHFSEIESLEFTTLGLCCFINPENDGRAFGNYEVMLKKVDELVRLLNLKVYQSNQQLLTISEVTEIRQKLSS
jgi:FtsZ-interacting cell division protein ZipA